MSRRSDHPHRKECRRIRALERNHERELELKEQIKKSRGKKNRKKKDELVAKLSRLRRTIKKTELKLKSFSRPSTNPHQGEIMM